MVMSEKIDEAEDEQKEKKEDHRRPSHQHTIDVVD